jgi:hypothetical protein
MLPLLLLRVQLLLVQEVVAAAAAAGVWCCLTFLGSSSTFSISTTCSTHCVNVCDSVIV